MAAKSDYSAGEEATRLVNELLRLESRGSGDLEAAMRRLANRYGLPWRVFWSVRYRHPKDLMCGVMGKLREAHVAETRRQLDRIRHELEIAKINGVHVDDIQNQVSALAAELEDCLAQCRKV